MQHTVYAISNPTQQKQWRGQFYVSCVAKAIKALETLQNVNAFHNVNILMQ